MTDDNTTWNALPAVVTTYLTAHQARDVATAISIFTDDAVVTDEGRTYRGRDEIATWLGSAGERIHLHDRIHRRDHHGPSTSTWSAPGRNFPGGVADLHYRFTLDGDAIRRLVIEP